MIKVFKAVLGGISFALLYIVVILISPFIIRFSGNTNFTSHPELINEKLYSIQVTGNEFNSHATAMGMVLSIVIGMVIYFLLNNSTGRKQKTTT